MYQRDREPMPGCLVAIIAGMFACGALFWATAIIGFVKAVTWGIMS